MKNDAEAHADEDKKKIERIQTLNNAEHMIYTTEDFITKNGEEDGTKLSNEDLAPLKECLEGLKTLYNVKDEDRDVDAIEFLQEFVDDFSGYYEQVLIHSRVLKDLEIEEDDNLVEAEIRYTKDDVKKIKAIADYQFGIGAGEALFAGNIKIEKSKKTGKIRHIYDGKTLIVNMRASDSPRH